MTDHVTQKFTRANTERTPRSIEAQFVPLQYFKNISEVTHVLGHHLTFHHHIIYINLKIFTKS